jgi:5-methylcytosine-specific restriction endonuclease McrA
MSEMFDGQGLAFADYRRKLPERAADFPRAPIRRDDLMRTMCRFDWDHCQMCACKLRKTASGDVHHIIGGAGRSDEETNLLRLCRDCHDESWSVMLPQALYVKWKTDRENLSWVRLALLYGKFLPIPKEGAP